MMDNNIRQMSAGAGMLHQPYATVTAYRQGNRELIHGKGIFATQENSVQKADATFDYALDRAVSLLAN